MSTIKRNCTICGAEFETSRPRQFHCPACANRKRAVCAVCGKEFVTDRRNSVRSCSGACARKLQRETLSAPDRMRTCAVCGRKFAPANPTARKCEDCRGKTLKACEVCGKMFAVYQSSISRVHTCPDCRPAYTRGKLGSKRPNVWSDEAKRRVDVGAMRERAQRQQPSAVDAARNDPKSGPYASNINAKVWTLTTPDGETIEVRNLALFCREHPEWFTDAEKAEAQIAYCARARRIGLPGRTWHGWGVIGQPIVPEDAKAAWEGARRKRERLEAARAERRSALSEKRDDEGDDGHADHDR